MNILKFSIKIITEVTRTLTQFFVFKIISWEVFPVVFLKDKRHGLDSVPLEFLELCLIKL